MALSLGEVTPKPFGAVHHLCLRRLSRSRQLPRTTSAESTRVSRPSSPVSLSYPPSGEDGVSPRRAMSGWRRPVRVGLIVTWNLSGRCICFLRKTLISLGRSFLKKLSVMRRSYMFTPRSAGVQVAFHCFSIRHLCVLSFDCVSPHWFKVGGAQVETTEVNFCAPIRT